MAQIASPLVSGNETPMPVVATDSAGNEYNSGNPLPVNVVNGSSAGTQYTDGTAAPAHPVGDELVFNNAGTMQAVSNTVGLPVDIVSGGTPTYTAGNAAPASPSGIEILFNNAGTLAGISNTVGLPVNVVAGGGAGGTSSSFGAAFPATGTAIGASDGTDMQPLLVESSTNKNLRTAIFNGANELAVDASGHIGINNFPATQAVNLTEINGAAISNANALPTTIQNWQSETPTNLNQVNGAALSNANPVPVNDVASTSGGATPYHLISAASTNATSLKASAGQVYGLALSNTNSSARYFKLYNLASAPTVGTSTISKTIQIPGNATVICAFPRGLYFSAGIAFATTANMADTDTTAVGAGDLSIDVDYL